ncbi:MAG: aldo/keto reductase [Clostridia bacterium]|nr:aldo/keto reductase [Clostridia bacterium]
MEFFTLNDGVQIPATGYGAYRIEGDECVSCVLSALEAGYRLIDTAQNYDNEAEVGAAIKSSGIKREEIFVTTKVGHANYGVGITRDSVLRSIEKLRLDSLDLCLLHQPWGDVYTAWRELEQLKAEGLIRSIGVCNFFPERLVDIALFSSTVPSVNQIECHPYFQRGDDLEVAKKYGVTVEAWSPFSSNKTDLHSNPTICRIAEAYGKSTAQIILRWQYQRGVITIPKTSKKERMAENISIFDFSLTDEDMTAMGALERNETAYYRHNTPAMVERGYGNFVRARGETPKTFVK